MKIGGANSEGMGGGGLPDLLQYYMGGGVSLGTPNFYYGQPRIPRLVTGITGSLG